MEQVHKIEEAIKEGFQAAPGSIAAIMNEAKHEVLNDQPTKLGENDEPVVSCNKSIGVGELLSLRMQQQPACGGGGRWAACDGGGWCGSGALVMACALLAQRPAASQPTCAPQWFCGQADLLLPSTQPTTAARRRQRCAHQGATLSWIYGSGPGRQPGGLLVWACAAKWSSAGAARLRCGGQRMPCPIDNCTVPSVLHLTRLLHPLPSVL